MPRWKGLFVPGLLGLLAACAQPVVPTEPLDFETDPRILRGLWAGTSEGGQRLVLDANPSEPKGSGYRVDGTFRLDEREPVVFSGGVRAEIAHDTGRVQHQTSPMPSPFDAQSHDGLWQLLGDVPTGSPPRFELILGSVSESYTFVMSAPTPTALAGTNWVLTTLRGEPALPGTEVTLEFTEERLGGTSGCNGYGAPYLATPATLEIIDGILSTAMLCDTPAGVMDQEAAYTRALSEATRYDLSGDRLELTKDGTVTLVFGR